VLNEQDKVEGSYVEGEAVTYASSGMTFELGDIVNGEEVTATNVCRTTEYFPCFGTMVCTLGLRYPAVVLYDAEMTYIRRVDPTARPTTLDLGDAKYFRLLVKNTSKLNEAKSYGGSYATHKWDNMLVRDYATTLVKQSEVEFTSRNVHDSSSMYTSTKQVNVDTGVISTTNLAGIATIPVLGGRIYCYDIPLYHVAIGGAQFKKDGTYIDKIRNIRARGGGYKFLTDIECSYIVMNVYPTAGRNYNSVFSLQEGEEVDPNCPPYAVSMVSRVRGYGGTIPYKKPSYSLPFRMIVLGDSITTSTQGRWFEKLMTNFNMKSLWTLGIGKARYAHYSDSVSTSNPEQNSHENIITNQVNKLLTGIQNSTYTKPDVVLIHAGVNDRMDSDTGPDGDTSMYGDPNTVFDPSVDYSAITDYGDSRLCTLAGGIRMAVETLWATYPDIRVVLTTPIYTGGAYNYKVQKINKIIKECAAWLSVPVIDLTYESQIYQRGTYWVDSLHPNEVGSILMADAIGHGLLRHFGWYEPMDVNYYTVSGSVVSGSTPQANYHMLWYSENYTYIDSYTDVNGEFTVELPIGNYSALDGSFNVRAYIDVRGDMSGVVINA
jgi:lysophospholipase L1-like esterase